MILPLALTLALVSAQASAPTLTLDPSTGTASHAIQVSGTGWNAFGSDVFFFLVRGEVDTAPGGDDVLLSTAPQERGFFLTTLTVPEVPPGAYTILACQNCFTSDDVNLRREATSVFTVVGPTVGPGGGGTETPGGGETPGGDGDAQGTEDGETGGAEGDGGQEVAGSGGTEGGGGFPFVPVVAVGVPLAAIAILLATSLGVGTVLTRGNLSVRLRRRWEEKAEDEDRPPCRGRWYCRRGEIDCDPALRRIVSVAVTLQRWESARPSRGGSAREDVLERLNDALSARRFRRGADEIRESVNTAARTLSDQVSEWAAEAAEPQRILLTARVEGGQGSCPFTLYHCERREGRKIWVERAMWTTTLKDERDYEIMFPSAFDPATPESRAILESALATPLFELIERVFTDRSLGRIKLTGGLEVQL